MGSRFVVGMVALMGVGVAWADPPLPRTFVPPEGGFSIAFPEEPETLNVPVKTAFGDVKVVLYSLVREGETYQVAHFDLGAQQVEGRSAKAIFQLARDGASRQLEAEVISEGELPRLGQQKSPGAEYVLKMPGNRMTRVRCYLVGNRFYQVIATGSETFVIGTAATDFLGSLRLKQASSNR